MVNRAADLAGAMGRGYFSRQGACGVNLDGAEVGQAEGGAASGAGAGEALVGRCGGAATGLVRRGRRSS